MSDSDPKRHEYPYDHDDPVTVGGKQVIFGDGFEYVAGEVLVDVEDLEDVTRLLRRRVKKAAVEVTDADAPVGSVSFDPGIDPLDVVDRLARAGVDASPNHVLKATWHGSFIGIGHARSADPSAWLKKQLSEATAVKNGPTVVVIDTGVVKHDMLPNVTGIGSAADRLTNPASKVYGHGCFVSGLITAECPEADIRMIRPDFGANNDNVFGLVTDLALSNAIELALSRIADIDVMNLSFGGYTHDGTPLKATNASVARAVRRGVTVVAGAGNDGLRGRPFYPAAEPGVIGVGSLDAKGNISCFSNTGPWVDVLAHGEDVVSTYPEAEVTQVALSSRDGGRCKPTQPVDERTERFTTGFAIWSGTSFAAARVTGGIARARIAR